MKRRDFLGALTAAGAIAGSAGMAHSMGASASATMNSSRNRRPDGGKANQPMTPQFWYEDNNMRKAGGYPPDFFEMFTQPEKWKELRRRIDVYYIRSNTLKNLFTDFGEAFVRDHFVKVLKDAGIPIAIDNVAEYKTAIPKLIEFGATVSHIALQSAISKSRPEEAPARVGQAVATMIEIKTAFPNLKVGLIDATPTKGRPYQELYRRLLEGVGKAGHRVDFIHLDCPCDQAENGLRVTWEKVKETERFVRRDLGLEFGFICVSARGGKESDETFYRDVMTIPARFTAHEIAPDHCILMSWFPHPSRSLPEDARDGEYPMTKAGLHLARGIKRDGLTAGR